MTSRHISKTSQWKGNTYATTSSSNLGRSQAVHRPLDARIVFVKHVLSGADPHETDAVMIDDPLELQDMGLQLDPVLHPLPPALADDVEVRHELARPRERLEERGLARRAAPVGLGEREVADVGLGDVLLEDFAMQTLAFPVFVIVDGELSTALWSEPVVIEGGDYWSEECDQGDEKHGGDG